MAENPSPNEVQLSDLIDTKKPEHVIDEIKNIISMVFHEFDFKPLESVFTDIIKLFNGDYPGYQKCNPDY